METGRFDRITQDLSARLTRRRALASVFGLAALGAPGMARAAHTCHRADRYCTRDGQCCTGYCENGMWVPRRRRFRCSCPSPLRACNEMCVDVLANPEHCGACNEPCVNGECIAGECRYRYRFV